MATYSELNNEYKKYYNKDFPRATLSRWVSEGKIKYNFTNNSYDYNLEDFLNLIMNEKYKKKILAHCKKPQDYIGKVCGELLIIGVVPKEESQQPNYTGTMVYCKCQNCGKIIQERFAYVSGNGNYQRESCGCLRNIRHFLASAKILTNDDVNWLKQFQNDWDRFSFLHHSLTVTGGIDLNTISTAEYKQLVEYFWADKQFNVLYNTWQEKGKNINTFYDWWRPSLDHIIPKSRGGLNTLNNFQFLTYYENHNKLDMTWEEWQQFKLDTHTTSELFIEAIMKGGDVNE